MSNSENSLIFQIEQFRLFYHFLNQSIIAIWKIANFPILKLLEFSKLDTFGIYIFFLIWKIIKIPKIVFLNFPNCNIQCFLKKFQSVKFGKFINFSN